MTKTTEKNFPFLREVKNGMISDTFYNMENYETFIMNDFEKSSAEKAVIMCRKKGSDICLFFRDNDCSFCIGQSVRIKAAWCESETERNTVFTIVEIDERLKRAVIEDTFSDKLIKQCQRVELSMIEKA